MSRERLIAEVVVLNANSEKALSTIENSDSAMATSASRPLSGTGVEWIVDAVGCDAESLRDLKLVERICNRVIADLGLKVIGQPQSHRFPGPAGVTAMYMLSESHLACHTYPEHGVATFNLYCCRARRPWPWQDELQFCLGATDVTVSRVERASSAEPGLLSSAINFNRGVKEETAG